MNSEIIKAQAKRLRADLARDGVSVTHSRALELTARLHGFDSWRALNAASPAPAGRGDVHAVHYDLASGETYLRVFTSEADLDADLLAFYRRWVDGPSADLGDEERDAFQAALDAGDLEALGDLFSDLTGTDYVYVYRAQPVDGAAERPHRPAGTPNVVVFVDCGCVTEVVTDADVTVTVLDADANHEEKTLMVEGQGVAVARPAVRDATRTRALLAEVAAGKPLPTDLEVLLPVLARADVPDPGVDAAVVRGMVRFLLEQADAKGADLYKRMTLAGWAETVDASFGDRGTVRTRFLELANDAALQAGPLGSGAFRAVHGAHVKAAVALLISLLRQYL